MNGDSRAEHLMEEGLIIEMAAVLKSLQIT